MILIGYYKSRAATVLTHRNGSNRIEPVEEGRMASNSICQIDECGKRVVHQAECLRAVAVLLMGLQLAGGEA